jgi:hypothetical protein
LFPHLLWLDEAHARKFCHECESSRHVQIRENVEVAIGVVVPATPAILQVSPVPSPGVLAG